MAGLVDRVMRAVYRSPFTPLVYALLLFWQVTASHTRGWLEWMTWATIFACLAVWARKAGNRWGEPRRNRP